MNAAPFVAPNLRKRQPEDLSFYLSEFKRAKSADDTDRLRCIRNMQAYTGLNDGQWSAAAKAELTRAGRDPKTYDLIRFLVAGHGGNYVMNSVDPLFVDREDDSVATQKALEALGVMWYSMKDRGRYKAETMLCIENGLVYRGVQELMISRPSSDPRSWYIYFPSHRPELVIFDPSNTTDSISRSAQVAWKLMYLSPQQMMRVNPDKTDEIMAQLNRREVEDGEQFEETDIDQFTSLDAVKLGSRRQVIEKLHIKHEMIMHQIHKPTGKLLPVTKYPLESIADIALKKAWGVRAGIELRDEDIATFRDFKPVNYLTRFCTSLNIILEDEKDERQLDGHLPLYAWSFLQKYGKSMGLVDFLVDAQDDLNKREMAKTKILTQTPIAGKPWISEDILDREGNTLDQVVEDFNDSSKPLITPAGMPGGNLFGTSPGVNVPSGLLQDESVKIDFMNKLAAFPLALQGITDRSGESALHLGRKVIEGTVMNRIPTEWVMQHEHDKAEDWLRVAIYAFGDIPNMPFVSNDGHRKTVINKVEGFDGDQPVISAEISALKRPDVIITMTKENDFLKQAKKEMAVGSLQAMGPQTPTNAPIHAVFTTTLARNMDMVGDEEKQKIEKACDLTLELAMEQAELALIQIRKQKEQLEQPPQVPPAAPGALPGGVGGSAPTMGPPTAPQPGAEQPQAAM